MESLNDRQKSYKLLEFNWYGISPMTFKLRVLERGISHKRKETCFFNLFLDELSSLLHKKQIRYTQLFQ